MMSLEGWSASWWADGAQTPMRAEPTDDGLSGVERSRRALKHSDGLGVPMWARGAL